MITITKRRALEIQAEQVAHYASIYGDEVRLIVAAETRADLLPEEDVEYDVVIVNRAIPRGGFIEALIERHGLGKTQVSERC
jgi:hypothetical protein